MQPGPSFQSQSINLDEATASVMKTVTLRIADSVDEKFFSLLQHFSASEVKILDQGEYISDDDYLRSISGMVDSINDARNEPVQNGVSLEKLDW